MGSFSSRLRELFLIIYGKIDSPQAGRVIAAFRFVERLRKVRTPQSTVPDNVRRGAISWIGPQKHTAKLTPGVSRKGEMVV